MDKLQKVKVALPESKRLFRPIFNQTFGFIELMEPMGIFMEGNQTALKFAGITSSKVIRCPLWEACLSDFSLLSGRPHLHFFSRHMLLLRERRKGAVAPQEGEKL